MHSLIKRGAGSLRVALFTTPLVRDEPTRFNDGALCRCGVARWRDKAPKVVLGKPCHVGL